MEGKTPVATYVGTKVVKAWPEARNGDVGMGVEYPDGYVSWSPQDAFDEAYRQSGNLSFGMALTLLKRGYLMRRRGWNGTGLFIYLVPGSRFQVNRAPLNEIYPEGTTIDYSAHIDMKTATGQCVPWLASQQDMLAEDWEIAAITE